VDGGGRKLNEDGKYVWDSVEGALVLDEQGNIGAEHIKLMRLMVSGQLVLAAKVQGTDGLMNEVLYIARAVNKV
jgi:hypothetical protein